MTRLQNLKQVVSFISLLNFQSNCWTCLNQIKNKSVHKIIHKDLLTLPPPPVPFLRGNHWRLFGFGSSGGYYITLYNTAVAPFLTYQF